MNEDATRRRGICLWFTGLSGSGKTTTAELLAQILDDRGETLTMLDGDVVRTHLSRGLGFSREDRDENVRRVGFVSAEIVRHGGFVICSLVSPYRETRDEVRAMIDAAGGAGSFVEVYVDTPLDVVMERDVKGLYASEGDKMTGLADPYEPPTHPEIHLETVGHTVEENVSTLLAYLDGLGRGS